MCSRVGCYRGDAPGGVEDEIEGEGGAAVEDADGVAGDVEGGEAEAEGLGEGGDGEGVVG